MTQPAMKAETAPSVKTRVEQEERLVKDLQARVAELSKFKVFPVLLLPAC